MNVEPLTPERWRDFADLFSRRGPRGGHRNTPAHGCWCMWWRDRALEHGEPKRRAMARIVRAGHEPGLLAYEDGSAVGWIAVAPREAYRALLRSPQYRPREPEQDVWSIVCFVVDKPARGRGIAAALVEVAASHACTRGACAVEAYPHATSSDDYMGSVALFRAAGFERVRDAGKRVVVRRDCG